MPPIDVPPGASWFRLRRAVPDDAPRLTDIAFAAKRTWTYPEAWISAWTDALTVTPAYVAETLVFVAEAEQASGPHLLGFYALTPIPDGFDLDHLWVDPVAQRRGLGTALFRHAVHIARHHGGGHLEIVSDPHATGFYTALGAYPDGDIRADVAGTRRVLPRLRLAL